MNQRLIYVIGPSGAGKDTILNAVRHQLSASANIRWAMRTITRPLTQVHGELHESVSIDEFAKLSACGAFVFEWEANKLHYGIRREALSPLEQNNWVFLNGSRQYLPTAAKLYPGLTVVHITAHHDIIKQRLISRDRESEAMIQERLNRLIAPVIPPDTQLIEVLNDTTVEAACHSLMENLKKLKGWSQQLG